MWQALAKASVSWRQLLCSPRTALRVGGIHRGETSRLERAGDAWGCLSRPGMHCGIISRQPSRLGISPWGHVGHLSGSACPDSLWVLVPGQPLWTKLSGMLGCQQVCVQRWSVSLGLHVCVGPVYVSACTCACGGMPAIVTDTVHAMPLCMSMNVFVSMFLPHLCVQVCVYMSFNV